MIMFNVLKGCIGIFVPQMKFAQGHQALCNWGQGILVATMVDNTNKLECDILY